MSDRFVKGKQMRMYYCRDFYVDNEPDQWVSTRLKGEIQKQIYNLFGQTNI